MSDMRTEEQASAWREVFDWCEAHGCEFRHDRTGVANVIAFLDSLLELAWKLPEPFTAEELAESYSQLPAADLKPVEPAPSTPEPFRAGDLVVGDFYYDNFRWEHIGMGGDITHYRVVEQPPAKYRPFASAEEFRPHRDRWLRCKEGHTYRVILVSELGVRIAWMTSLIQFDEMFNTFVFDDNSEPCGVRE